jgi:hypothetical protein
MSELRHRATTSFPGSTGHPDPCGAHKRIEQPFGWIKTVGGGRELRYIGRAPNRAWFKTAAAGTGTTAPKQAATTDPRDRTSRQTNPNPNHQTRQALLATLLDVDLDHGQELGEYCFGPAATSPLASVPTAGSAGRRGQASTAEAPARVRRTWSATHG